MKPLLLLILIFLACNLQAQDKLPYSKKDAYIGAGVLVGTFIYYDQNRGLTPTQSNITVATGMGTSILTYYVISPTIRKFVIPKVKKWAGKRIEKRIKLKLSK